MSYFEFQSMTEEQIDRLGLMEEGKYDFEVVKSERKSSSKGNPMAELQLKVWGNDGHARILRDYLVFTPQQLCMRKIKHFCEAVGLEEEYKKGQIPEKLDTYCGRLKLEIKAAEVGKDGKDYPAKNNVADYLKRSKNEPRNVIDKNFDDDIPF